MAMATMIRKLRGKLTRAVTKKKKGLHDYGNEDDDEDASLGKGHHILHTVRESFAGSLRKPQSFLKKTKLKKGATILFEAEQNFKKGATIHLKKRF